MAAFTHLPVDERGGRFNRNFGIYYCAADEAVASLDSRTITSFSIPKPPDSLTQTARRIL